jgi:hypothetical protein
MFLVKGISGGLKTVQQAYILYGFWRFRVSGVLPVLLRSGPSFSNPSSSRSESHRGVYDPSPCHHLMQMFSSALLGSRHCTRQNCGIRGGYSHHWLRCGTGGNPRCRGRENPQVGTTCRICWILGATYTTLAEITLKVLFLVAG